MIQLKLDDIKQYYHLLGHSKPTEIRVFGGKFPEGRSVFVPNEEAFLREVKRYNVDEQVNVYAGYRDRIGKKDRDVIASCGIFIEIDEHDVKKPEEKKKLEKYLLMVGLKVGAIAFSGRGFHFYVPHDKIILSDDKERDGYRQLLRFLKDLLLKENIDIDPKCFDISRVTRVIGSWNHKRRACSKWVKINQLTDEEKRQNWQILQQLFKAQRKELVKVEGSALQILQRCRISKDHPWLYEVLEKGILIKEDTGGNSVVFKNAAIILVAAGLKKDELKTVGQELAKFVQGRSLAAFMGWVRKAEQGEISEVAEGEINRFIDEGGFYLTRYVKKMRREDEAVLNLLDEDELNTQYLDIGEAGGVFYYGLNLRGKEAIVTSEKRVLRNTLERFKDRTVGENQIKELFSYIGYISDIAPTWSKKSIKRYLTERPTLSKRGLFEEIKGKIDYYIDFDKFAHSSTVQACWVMATYVYPLFFWFPHLLLNAPSGSGKSKNAYVLMQMSFRGYDLGASAGVTPAQIFRTIEGNRGTVLIDEFERIDNDSQKLVNQILNASATRDAYVIRTEQIDKKWKAWKFPIFCPKIVCNITGINPTSLSRFISFNLLKTQTIKGKRKPYRQKDKEAFIPLRDRMHVLMLKHWQEIKELYDSLELNLSNRDEDNWLPVCTVAKWLGDDIFREVMEYILAYKEIVIETNDLTETLFLRILDHVTDDPAYYSPKVIAEWMEAELGMYKCPDRFIGKKLKEFKFKPVHRENGNCYLLDKSRINDIIKRYFPDGTKKSSETSVSSSSSSSSDSSGNPEVSEDTELFSGGIAPKKSQNQPLKVTEEAIKG